MTKSTLWAQHKVGADVPTKEELNAILLSSSKGFSLLAGILEAKLEAVRKERYSKDGYSHPAWPFEQADLNGQERQLRAVLDLIDPLCYNKHTI